MTSPLVSVVIPARNMDRYLTDALRSVFAQDYRPIEVIVVDDGSTDETAAVARGFAEVRYFRQPHLGIASARNRAIGCATGDFIAFQDADDLWAPEKLTVQMTWLLAHPETMYVAAHYRNFLQPGMPRPSWISEAQLHSVHRGGVPNVLVRRAMFERVGLFDASHAGSDVLDWLLRARDAGCPGEFLPQVLFSRRVHDGNRSSQEQRRRAAVLRTLKTAIDRQRAGGRRDDSVC